MFIYKIKNYKIKNLKLKRKAFTLLELLLVIGITAVLSAVGVGFYVNQQKTKILDNTAQEIANYLRYAQQKSIAQEQGQQWGVHFENPTSGNGFYALYTGTTYSSPIETKYLPAGIEFQTPASGNSVNVSFNKLTGLNYSGAEQEIIIRLTSNQVARVIRTMSNGLVVVSEGEKGYWKFDEGSGTTAYDSTIYKNNGTLVNGPTWQSPSNCVSGSCLSFDGSSNYVEVPHSASLMPSAVSAEAWIYPRSYAVTWARILEKGGNQVGGGYGLEFNPGGNETQRFCIWNGTTPQYIDSTTILDLNKWWYIVGTFDGTTMKLYINGKLEASGSATMTSNTWDLFIGRAAGSASNYFNGFIDQVRIYNRALSPAEILQHYNSRS